MLQIKSDLWNSKTASEDGDCSSKKSDDDNGKSENEKALVDKEQKTSKEFLVNLETLIVKKETASMEDATDDDREEGEIQDADDDVECKRVSSRRRSSSNPVNLSLNAKINEPDDTKENANTDGDSSNEVHFVNINI